MFEGNAQHLSMLWHARQSQTGNKRDAVNPSPSSGPWRHCGGPPLLHTLLPCSPVRARDPMLCATHLFEAEQSIAVPMCMRDSRVRDGRFPSSAHWQMLSSAKHFMTVTHRFQASLAGHVCDAGLQVVPFNVNHVLPHPSHDGCLAASYSTLQPTLAGGCCDLPQASGRSCAAGRVRP